MDAFQAERREYIASILGIGSIAPSQITSWQWHLGKITERFNLSKGPVKESSRIDV